MSQGGFTESVVGDAALGWLEPLGNALLHGPDIASGELRMKGVESIAEATA